MGRKEEKGEEIGRKEETRNGSRMKEGNKERK